jgi:hypothetical protein
MLGRHAATTARLLRESGASRVYLAGSGETGSAIDAALNEATNVIAVLTEVLSLSE